MIQHLRHQLTDHLLKCNLSNDYEVHAYLIAYVSTIFCLLIHIYFFAINLMLHLTIYAFINVGSVFVHIIAYHLLRHKRYNIVSLLISAEVCLYASFCVFTSGIDNYVLGYYIIVIILLMILPFRSSIQRNIFLAFVLMLGGAGLAYNLLIGPSTILNDKQQTIILVSNVCILFVCTTLLLQLVVLVREITETYSLSRVNELTVLANTDTLTGLYNRRFADTYLSQVIPSKKEQSFCVAMLDIDDFKNVNDNYGHETGDKVLMFLARFISDNLRKSDMVFRWGGEEILIILDNVTPELGHRLLDKLRHNLEQQVIVTQTAQLHITVTIGLCSLNPQNPSESIRICDNNLYEGKRKSKNCVVSS